MIPISLKFKAFESYAEETYIDFTALDSLFLITGNTGAGKTAILDAITYALYQKTSGGKRDHLVRSQLPQCENVDTIVEFEFEVKSKKYKFCRTIKRGKSENKTAECFYFDDKADEYVLFPIKHISTEVNQKAKDILGLDYEQFKQVIILPQGQFEELLTSKSADKEAILETLFDAKRYSDLSDMLKKQAMEQKKQLDTEKSKLDAMLKNEGFDNDVSMFKEIVMLKRELKNIRKNLDEKRRGFADIQKDFSAALMLDKDFKEHYEVTKKLAGLLEKEHIIKEYSLKIGKHLNAFNASPLYLTYNKSNETLDKRQRDLSICQNALETAKNVYNSCILNGEELKKTEDEYLSKRDKLSRLMLVKDKYEKFEGVQKNTDRLKNEFNNADFTLTELQKKLNVIDKMLTENLSQRQDIQTNYIQKLPVLETLLGKLNLGKNAYEKYTRYSAALEDIKLLIAGYDSKIHTIEMQIKSASLHYNDVFSKHINMLSSELVHQLRDGCECPVCGSKEHPNPAKITHENVSAEDVASARKILDNLNDSLNKLLSEKSKQSDRITSAKENIEEQYKIFAESEYSKEKLDNTEKEKAAADEKLIQLDKLNSEYESMNMKKLDFTKELSSLTDKRNKLNDEYTYSQNELKSIKSQLINGISALSDFIAETDILSRFIIAYEEKKAVHEHNMRSAENNKLNAQTAFDIAEKEKINAQNEVTSSFEKLSEKLSILGITDITEYLNTLLSDEILNQYTRQVEEFKEKSLSLKSRNDELCEMLKDKDKPDMTELEKVKSECENILMENEKRNAVIMEKCTRLISIYKEHKVSKEKHAVLFEKNVKRMEFAEFMWGKQGMSFSRYVLGVLFGLVAEEANTLLRSVHNGQFRIYVGSNKNAGNSKQGLDLMVENSLSDVSMSYDVKGLSGGEKFLISLALSMGLGAVAQSYSGGIDIDTMFIDEGFGSLDPTSLREAVDVLCKINQDRKKIGIISHVDGLAEVISCAVNVSKSSSGSKINISR